MRPKEIDSDCDPETDDKLCGVFSSRSAAEAAITHLKRLDGFKDYPDCFLVDTYTLDEIQWTSGFVHLPDD
jgi:hypothetical protein